MRTFVANPSIKTVRGSLPNFAKPARCFQSLTSLEIEAGNVVGTRVASARSHPFISTLHACFADHRPLELRPDDFWLMIAQGLSQHLSLCAESVRSLFVNHDGRELIEVIRDDFIKGGPMNDWPGVFEEFDQKIAAKLKGDSHRMIKQQFSTTGPVDQAAYSVVLLESMKAYFQYRVLTRCGIPEVTLLGETLDWARLYAAADTLYTWWRNETKNLPDQEKISLTWWSDAVMPVLERIAYTADGAEIDTNFWQSIYKLGNHSGGPYIHGWVNVFFPYANEKGAPADRNKHLDWSKSGGWGGMTSDRYPTGVSAAPFIWKYLGKEYRMLSSAVSRACRKIPIRTLCVRQRDGR
jgi:hypothetical protein